MSNLGALLREYFTFSNRQRKGLVVLIAVFVLLCFALAMANTLVRPKTYEHVGFGRLEEQVEVLFGDDDSLQPKPLARFDPNTTSPQQWRSMGLEDRVVKSIMNYKAKGGKFYRKEDVLRIYGFSKEDYLRLSPHMRIEGDPTHYERYPDEGTTPFRLPDPIDVNRADSATWTALKGIGPVLAARILKFRNQRGGFTDPNQLKDVYGLSPETFQSIRPYLYVDSTWRDTRPVANPLPATTATSVEINGADSATLEALPGLGGYSARSIIRYRDRLGGFSSLKQLEEVSGLRPENLQKFMPLLQLDTALITKLDLNESSHAQLTAHPYISQSLADFIVTYRQRSAFRSISEVRKSFLVDDALFARLKPYLTCRP
jgi:DNA uptake protein ComE-like DNA-binding protein